MPHPGGGFEPLNINIDIARLALDEPSSLTSSVLTLFHLDLDYRRGLDWTLFMIIIRRIIRQSPLAPGARRPICISQWYVVPATHGPRTLLTIPSSQEPSHISLFHSLSCTPLTYAMLFHKKHAGRKEPPAQDIMTDESYYYERLAACALNPFKIFGLDPAWAKDQQAHANLGLIDVSASDLFPLLVRSGRTCSVSESSERPDGTVC